MGDFNSKYSGEEVEGLLDKIANIGDSTGSSPAYFLNFTVEDLHNASVSGTSVVLDSPAAFVDAITAGSRICIFDSAPPAGYMDVSILYFRVNQTTGIIWCDMMIPMPGTAGFVAVAWAFKYTDNSAESEGISFEMSQLYQTAEMRPSDGEIRLGLTPYVIYYVRNPITYLEIVDVSPNFFDGVNHASILFQTGDDFSFATANMFMWPNGVIPTFEPNTSYELSFATSPQHGNTTGVSAILVPFKFPEE